MFTFYVWTPRGKSWTRQMNEQANSYQEAAAQVAQRTGCMRVKIEGSDTAEQSTMGYRFRVINFESMQRLWEAEQAEQAKNQTAALIAHHTMIDEAD